MPASQAGRHGFDPRLPLQSFQQFSQLGSSSLTSFTSKTRFARRFCTPLLLLAASQGALKFCDCFKTAFKIALSIRIKTPIGCPLICGNFGFNFSLCPRLACVRRSTWKLTQPGPTFPSFFWMFRRRKLSRDRKVPRSDGNIGASGAVSVEICRHAAISQARSGGLGYHLKTGHT